MKGTLEKKLTYIIRFFMMTLTTILIVLFFMIMSLVGKIQGTARVVNYAGLVRGKTQRIIKLEDAGQPQDGMIDDVSSFIEGLRFGSDDLNLVRLDDDAFQTKMEELDTYFADLKNEIMLVRENGYENTQIIEKSEIFFGICDEATGLAEAYSQKKATALSRLEKVVVADIIGLILIIGAELVKALRYAAINRALQKKVYLDEATGLPNKNKCEEILNAPDPIPADNPVAMCVFDLNNLRMINNNLGHDKGDEYIRSFAIQLKEAVTENCFAGRDGGDEFIAVLYGADHQSAKTCLKSIREHADAYSEANPEMPISYAAGYALSSDFEGCTMRELFRYADKNMYIDKNRAKMEEASQRQKINRQILEMVGEKGYDFSDCLYCDAMLDQYRILRASSNMFLAEDGSYSGAVEQIVHELSTDKNRAAMRRKLQLEYLGMHLKEDDGNVEFVYRFQGNHHGRLTAIFFDATETGELHHFVIGFEPFYEINANEKIQLSRFYDQMKQSILENGNYVDALLDTAMAVYTVNLTHDKMEKIFYQTNTKRFDIELELPSSYDEYCAKRSQYVTDRTLENYRIIDTSDKLLRRFMTGTKQLTVEYQERGKGDQLIWLQKTVLLSRDTLYDSEAKREHSVVRGIILYKDTSVFHEQEQKERERLEEVIQTADLENKTKTEFMNRMSHDIRTPINGIMGMLEIIRKNRQDEAKIDECLDKIQYSTSHLLALVNDVLDMNKLESGKEIFKEESFDIEQLMKGVRSLVDAQIAELGITHQIHRENIVHNYVIGSPLHVRQIMLNLFSNAIKYNKPGGTVDTYAEEISCDGTTVVYEFKIVDTGIGMSREFVEEQLFEPFTQEKSGARTRYKGTGLGMSIVKALIDRMNGSVQVESELGKGTTFIFRLPFKISESRPESQGMSADGKNVILEGRHVLLVEDNEINMEIAEFYLNEAGAVIEKAWNGKEAVEIFEKSEPGSIDLILMDLMMPVMDGVAATRKIRSLEREDAKKIPVLAMTAQAASGSAGKCREAGMNGHIVKPVESAKLLEILQNYLH